MGSLKQRQVLAAVLYSILSSPYSFFCIVAKRGGVHRRMMGPLERPAEVGMEPFQFKCFNSGGRSPEFIQLLLSLFSSTTSDTHSLQSEDSPRSQWNNPPNSNTFTGKSCSFCFFFNFFLQCNSKISINSLFSQQ